MIVLGVSAALSLMLSLAGKFLADAFLQDRFAIIGSFAGLQYSLNPGIAFGIRLPRGVQEILILCALFFVCGIAWKSAHSLLSRIGFGCILGGALGNVIDRFPDGFVTDFFQIGTFPIFNVADSFITIGVSLLLVESFVLHRRHMK